MNVDLVAAKGTLSTLTRGYGQKCSPKTSTMYAMKHIMAYLKCAKEWCPKVPLTSLNRSISINSDSVVVVSSLTDAQTTHMPSNSSHIRKANLICESARKGLPWQSFCDSDFAGNTEEQNQRRSGNGYIATYDGAPIRYGSQVPSVVSAHPNIDETSAQQSAHFPGLLPIGPAPCAPKAGRSVSRRRRSSACASFPYVSKALAGQLLMLPYLGNCLIKHLPSGYLAVQRRSGYGRATQFQTGYLTIMLHCSSLHGSCHCACSLPSAPICLLPWRRLQDDIHIRQVGQSGPCGSCFSLWSYSDKGGNLAYSA